MDDYLEQIFELLDEAEKELSPSDFDLFLEELKTELDDREEGPIDE